MPQAATGAAGNPPRSPWSRPTAATAATTTRLVDLRVDDHPDPVGELRRLYDIHVLLNGTTPEEQKLPLEGDAGARRFAISSRAPAT